VAARINCYQRAITFTHVLDLKKRLMDEYRKFFYTTCEKD
jgi:hypothetical protein